MDIYKRIEKACQEVRNSKPFKKAAKDNGIKESTLKMVLNIKPERRKKHDGCVVPYKKKFKATIQINGKKNYLGLYKTEDLAKQAIINFKQKKNENK